MTNKRHKILVVDDLLDWRITLRGLLNDEGYEVEVAGSAVKALSLLQTGYFDLVVLDMRLDETDEDNIEGLDLAEKIRQKWPAVKVIIITGYSTPDRLTRALKPDAQGQRLVVDFIPKTETEELVQIVQSLLVQ